MLCKGVIIYWGYHSFCHYQQLYNHMLKSRRIRLQRLIVLVVVPKSHNQTTNPVVSCPL